MRVYASAAIVWICLGFATACTAGSSNGNGGTGATGATGSGGKAGTGGSHTGGIGGSAASGGAGVGGLGGANGGTGGESGGSGGTSGEGGTVGGSGGTSGGGTGGSGGAGGSGGGPSTSCTSYVDITSAVQNGGVYSGIAVSAPADAATCTAGLGPKAELYYHAPATANVRIDVTSNKPASDPTASDAYVFVRTNCAWFTSEIACNASASTKQTYAGIDMQGLSFTGDTYIVVGGAYFDAGFQLKLTSVSSCFGDSDCAAYETAKCNQLTGVCDTKFQCPKGTDDCDGKPENGCETNTDSDVKNCGGCSDSCDLKNASAATCSAGACNFTCSSGYANCDAIGYNGCETELAISPKHCSACGKSCNGGVCTAGSCGPMPQVLATSSLPLVAMVIDAGYIFYAEQYGNLLKVPVTGGTPQILAASSAIGIGTLGGYLYWTDGNTLKKMSESGGTITDLPKPNGYLRGFTMDADGIYYSTDYGVYALPYAATAATQLTTGTVYNMVTDASTLFFQPYQSYSASLDSMPKTGGSKTPLGSAYGGGRMDVDTTTIFIAGNDLVSVPKIAGTSTTLYQDAIQIYDLILDQNTIYFEAGDWVQGQALIRIPKTGGNYTTLATMQKDLTSMSDVWHRMDVDASYVYWIDGSSLKRTAK